MQRMQVVSVHLHHFLVSPNIIWLPWQHPLTNRKIRYRSIICTQSAFIWWKGCENQSTISRDIPQNVKVFLACSAKLPTGLYILFALISSFFLCLKSYFFTDISDINHFWIHWTDFHNLDTEWKRFGCRWWIWTYFSNISSDVAMATNFFEKMANSPLSSLCHSETEWDITAFVPQCVH